MAEPEGIEVERDPSAKEPSVEIGWDEAQAKINERMSKEVTRSYDFGDGTKMTFVLRALTPEESEVVEALASQNVRKEAEQEAIQEAKSKRGGRRNNVDFKQTPDTEEGKVTLSDMKDQMLMYGIVRGPLGWEKSEQSIHILPQTVRTDIVDTLDTLSNLDVETEAGFRPSW